MAIIQVNKNRNFIKTCTNEINGKKQESRRVANVVYDAVGHRLKMFNYKSCIEIVSNWLLK